MAGEAASSERSELRSAANRIAALSAGQDQLATDVEKLRGQMHSLMILSSYTVAICGLIFFTVRSLLKGAAK